MKYFNFYLCPLPFRSVRIGRDPLTNLSRGVCFLEMESVYDAMTLFNKLMSRPPTIDNRTVSCNPPFRTVEIYFFQVGLN